MTTTPKKPVFSKGDRAAVVAGRSGLGVRGEVFWTGENKYGSGMRYGLRGDNGKTYWLDDECIGKEEGAPEPPPIPEGQKGPAFDKGDRVTIIEGPSGMGVSGKVFWIGESRYSKQPRYGVKGDNEETYWVDHEQVKAEEGSGDEAGGAQYGNANRNDASRSNASRNDGGRGRSSGPNQHTPQQRPNQHGFSANDPAANNVAPSGQPLQVSDDELPPEAFMDEQSLDDFSGMPPDDF